MILRKETTLALRVLLGLTGALEAWLLALFDARITRQVATFAQHRVKRLVALGERTRQPMTHGVGLPGRPAAEHFYRHGEALAQTGHVERPLYKRQVHRARKVLIERLFVDDELTPAGVEPHARDRGFSPSDTFHVISGQLCHEKSLCLYFAFQIFGFWAWCGWLLPR